MLDVDDALGFIAEGRDLYSSRFAKICGDILERCSPKQRNLITDPSRYISLLTPRQVGKTWQARANAFHTALSVDGANVIYIAQSRRQAGEILWKPVDDGLKAFDTEYELGCHFDNTLFSVRTPNNSRITLAGCDTWSEIDNLRGQKFDLAILDECKNWRIDIFEELVYQVLAPAMLHRDGRIVVQGTPGKVLAGPFYEATRPGSPIARPFDQKDLPEWAGRDYRWSFHTWNAQHHESTKKIWERALEDKRIFGWADDDPMWRREYLGEWVSSETDFVYNLGEHNFFDPDPESDNEFGLPAGHDWQYVEGVDFGWDDPVAISVGAWAEDHPDFFVIFNYKQRNMLPSDIGERLVLIKERFGYFNGEVADPGGGGRSIIEELNSRFGLNLQPADKTEKKNYISLFNSDLRSGRIKILRSLPVIEEMRSLTWNEKGMEDKNFPNHLCDATLYMWRFSYHHFFKERKLQPAQGSAAAEQLRKRVELATMLAKKRDRASDDNPEWLAEEKFEMLEMVDENDELWEEDEWS